MTLIETVSFTVTSTCGPGYFPLINIALFLFSSGMEKGVCLRALFGLRATVGRRKSTTQSSTTKSKLWWAANPVDTHPTNPSRSTVPTEERGDVFCMLIFCRKTNVSVFVRVALIYTRMLSVVKDAQRHSFVMRMHLSDIFPSNTHFD